MGVTPDESVQRVDLDDHRVIVLARNAAFPAARRNDSYVFDEDAFTPATRDRLVAACRTLAAVHGGGVVAGAAASAEFWRVSDTSHPAFGEVVPSVVLANDDFFVKKEATALVCIEQKWTFAAVVLIMMLINSSAAFTAVLEETSESWVTSGTPTVVGTSP